MKNLFHTATTLKDGFWKYYENLDREVTAKAVYDRFAETGRFDALKCNWREGMENMPHVYWDSDIAKWMEGAAYLLEKKPDPELEKKIDELVATIAKNQREDGYFNSYFLSVAPSKIFSDRNEHELYCIGHLIECAIAYHRATGKNTLLNVVKKAVDLIYQVFVVEQSAGFVTPGHQEIELALLKLYEYEGNEKHLELAKFFLDQRGANEKDSMQFKQVQSTEPVRAITEAVGHSVRAGYMYTAMARLAKLTGDQELLDACYRVYEDITTRKMSITGGIGADHNGERFTYAYDLPNREIYNETCAAISLAMFAAELQEIKPDSKYADLIERIYFNAFLSGVSISGDEFFYTNPLEIDRKKHKRKAWQPIFRRVKVFDCSCCPPNVVRTLATLPRYSHSQDGDSIWCHQFFPGKTEFSVGGEKAVLTLETAYPADGTLSFSYRGKPATIFVRIPDWCVEYQGKTENGYAEFEVENGAKFEVSLPLVPHFIEANPNVQDNAGRYAIAYGPFVYCMESIDNGKNLRDITLIENGKIEIKLEGEPLVPVLYIPAERRKPSAALYSIKTDKRVPFTARLIPYFSFANRDEADMLVWTMLK